MALQILDRPQGVKLSATANTSYGIGTAGYGDAILSGGSGLSDGDEIYIKNSFTSYNGFWTLQAHGPNEFRLLRLGEFLQYTQDQANAEIYVSVTDVDWSAVHLPIVYTLTSNVWPVNSLDSIRMIVGFANDNGFVRITLSGSINLDVLDWLDIQSTSEDELDGPFQILTKYSNTQYTIDAPYSLASLSPYTYASATAQKYYNNYAAKVRIYGGLRNTHPWYALKPYELITEIVLQPDADNQIKVNVADILKQKIQVLDNRPNYDSMPYDLDRFCEFWIEYAETYDESDGVDVETFTDSYQSDFDFFIGKALDASLDFKSRYSGFMSDYVYGSGSSYAKILTLEAVDDIKFWPGWYKDLSIILNDVDPSTTALRVQYVAFDASGNNLGGSAIDTLIGPYEGVLRVPLQVISTPGSTVATQTLIISTVGSGSIQRTDTYTMRVVDDCHSQYIYLTWKNALGGFNYWLFTSNKVYGIAIGDTQQKDKNIYPQWPHSYGEHQDRITSETYRTSKQTITVRAENLTEADVQFISSIKTSSLVQQMTSKYDRRVVLVDSDSFSIREDNQKLHTLEFDLEFTNVIGTQSL